MNSENGENELVFSAVMMSSFSPELASKLVDKDCGGLTTICTRPSRGGSEKTVDIFCNGNNGKICSLLGAGDPSPSMRFESLTLRMRFRS